MGAMAAWARMAAGVGCFVAGTQVVMSRPGDDVTASQLGPALPLPHENAYDRWLWSFVVVGAGIAGCRAASQRKRREDEQAAERAATERLFHDLEDDDMLDGTAVGNALRGVP